MSIIQGLAGSYGKIEQPRKAMKLFKRPPGPQCVKQELQMWDFMSYEVFGKYKEAIVCVKYGIHTHKKALHYRHNDYLFWNTALARIYVEDSQPQKAAAFLQKVISNRENKVESENVYLLDARVYLADAFIKLGHPQEPLPILREVTRIRADISSSYDKRRIWYEHLLSHCLDLIEQNTSEDGVYIPDSDADSLDNLPDIDPDNLSDIHTPDISDYCSFEISDPEDDSEPESPSESHPLRVSDSKSKAVPGDSSNAGREFAPEASSI
ncbi:hypothetical protein HYALB_00009296 [Hymenoscyphus albidus]|uniref:Uncharacterized protein n=1 Tax=Hymenoscyphus albidus TaxID=595503 RepID=A0A9N9LMF5_9HELO|nr:hypothetical protein HYALB_00009296 [Hymenoscyphus albidus]